MLWHTRTRAFDLTHRALIMGVLNVTPDSFSDGGLFNSVAAAVEQGRRLAEEGADIIDIGGESTRPGAGPLDEEEEARRVLPVISALAEAGGPVLSIDTRHWRVARAALDRGAAIVNDVTGLRDPSMREVVRATGAGAIAMHLRGEPATMQEHPQYADVCADVRDFFRQALAASVASGIHPMRLAFDPGIGFGKTVEHNLALLRGLESLRVEDRPLALGVSRKSFIGQALGTKAMEDRAWPTVALSSYARTRGANLLRVHEARTNREAVRMTEAILDLEAHA